MLERNPNYTGSRPHHLDRMELTIGVPQRKADAQIEAGTADYALDGVDPATPPESRRATATGARRRRTAGNSTSSTSFSRSRISC